VRLHREVLGRRQLLVLRRLGRFLEASPFYLAGGTGLALHLGHRRSVDFDWFCERPIEQPLRLARQIEDSGLSVDVEDVERGTLHARASGVRLSFLEYRYPLLRPLLTAREPGLRVASLEDIAAMKLAAVAQRGSRKDFVDLFALGRVLTLEQMLDLYRRKYGIRDAGHVLFGLSYFDDADKERMPVMLRRWSWAEIKDAVRGWVRRVTAQ
jgi:hypothetical protein